MGFNTIDRSTNPADFMLKKSIDKNRYLTRLAGIDHAIDGLRTEAILTVHDPVGTRNQGEAADPPVPIFNCRLKMKGG